MRTRLVRPLGWLIASILVLMFAAMPVMAGGIINKQNQSADYMRTLNRHAATDAADIASYNPAGIMQMQDGLYTKLDLMYFDKDYSNDVPGFGELSQDEPSIIPGFYSVYKQKKWAAFFAFTIPAGGGELDYDDGNARTIALAQGVAAQANALLPPALAYDQIDPGQIEVKQSTVYGFTLGGSFAINDVWSVAAGARFSSGVREFEGQATISSSNPVPPFNDPLTPDLNLEEDADGWAGVFGVNFAPTDTFTAALTYITNTKMEYKMDVKRDTLGIAPALGFADGSKRRIDIPGLLGFGVSYRFLPELKVDVNYTYYLEKDAKIDTYSGEGNSWDLGVAAEYTFTPQWRASLGYLMTDIKVKDEEQINEPEEPKLDANTVAAGLVWDATPDLSITFGAAYVMYDEVDDSNNIEYDKTVWNASLGIQYRFF